MISVIERLFIKHSDTVVCDYIDVQLYDSLQECAKELVNSFENELKAKQLNLDEISYDIMFIPLDVKNPNMDEMKNRYDKAKKEIDENGLNWFEYRDAHLEDFRVATSYTIYLDEKGYQLRKDICTFFGSFSNLGVEYDLNDEDKKILDGIDKIKV